MNGRSGGAACQDVQDPVLLLLPMLLLTGRLRGVHVGGDNQSCSSDILQICRCSLVRAGGREEVKMGR